MNLILGVIMMKVEENFNHHKNLEKENFNHHKNLEKGNFNNHKHNKFLQQNQEVKEQQLLKTLLQVNQVKVLEKAVKVQVHRRAEKAVGENQAGEVLLETLF